MKNEHKITLMKLDHTDAVVAVHLAAFQGFTLSILGPRFLQEFYKGVLNDPTGIAFVITDQQGLIGFVAGSAQPNGYYCPLLVG